MVLRGLDILKTYVLNHVNHVDTILILLDTTFAKINFTKGFNCMCLWSIHYVLLGYCVLLKEQPVGCIIFS